MNHTNSRILAALTTVIAAYGCSSARATTPPTNAPASAPKQPTSELVINPNGKDLAKSGTINILQDIRDACGMSDDEAHFEFDSDHVLDRDRRTLRALADCFVSGPLKGRKMSLVGHADPRGPEDYNLALAGRRADNVKVILVAETMAEGNVATTSRGAMDATGTDEGSWANDRRVDVSLGR